LKGLADVVKALEPLRARALVPKATVERLDVGIVDGLAGADEVHIDSTEVDPRRSLTLSFD
jgi:hypothetical protein